MTRRGHDIIYTRYCDWGQARSLVYVEEGTLVLLTVDTAANIFLKNSSWHCHRGDRALEETFGAACCNIYFYVLRSSTLGNNNATVASLLR